MSAWAHARTIRSFTLTFSPESASAAFSSVRSSSARVMSISDVT